MFVFPPLRTAYIGCPDHPPLHSCLLRGRGGQIIAAPLWVTEGADAVLTVCLSGDRAPCLLVALCGAVTPDEVVRKTLRHAVAWFWSHRARLSVHKLPSITAQSKSIKYCYMDAGCLAGSGYNRRQYEKCINPIEWRSRSCDEATPRRPPLLCSAIQRLGDGQCRPCGGALIMTEISISVPHM